MNNRNKKLYKITSGTMLIILVISNVFTTPNSKPYLYGEIIGDIMMTAAFYYIYKLLERL